jgi:hypothetical protein
MSTRCKPVKVVEHVNVLAPTAKSRYYRLTWIEPDGRPGSTSGRRTLSEAMSKAADIDAGLQRATGPKSLTPLDQIKEEYLASPEKRNQKTRKDCISRFRSRHARNFAAVGVVNARSHRLWLRRCGGSG